MGLCTQILKAPGLKNGSSLYISWILIQKTFKWSSPGYSPLLQIQISNFLLNTSIWIYHRHHSLINFLPTNLLFPVFSFSFNSIYIFSMLSSEHLVHFWGLYLSNIPRTPAGSVSSIQNQTTFATFTSVISVQVTIISHLDHQGSMSCSFSLLPALFLPQGGNPRQTQLHDIIKPKSNYHSHMQNPSFVFYFSSAVRISGPSLWNAIVPNNDMVPFSHSSPSSKSHPW